MMFSLFRRMDSKARLACIYSAAAAQTSKFVEPLHILAAVETLCPDLVDKRALRAAKLALPRVAKDPFVALRQGFSGVEGFSMPLSEASKKVLATADRISQDHASNTVGVPHLLLAILTEEKDLRTKLRAAALDEQRLKRLCKDYRPTKEDLEYADEVRKYAPRSYRSGVGYDLHRLARGRKLMIGGVEVPFDKGSVGHSDGDVLSHALCDALLGASGLGDIGTHFPDTDPQWKGVSSLLFLEHARKLLDEKRLHIANIDAVIVCERPKLGPHFSAMRATLANCLRIAPEQINLKAKTNEGTGEIGRGEAIAAHVIATLESQPL